MSQNDYCAGKVKPKYVTYGNFPTYTIPLTSGWIKSNPHSDEFNGNSLDIGKWDINTSTNITLWAKEEIVFEKGFEVSAGTPFTARIIHTEPELFIDGSSSFEQDPDDED